MMTTFENGLVTFENWTVPAAFMSDGCSVPFVFRLPARLFLSMQRAQPACRLHDFLSSHARWHGMDYPTIDAIFRRHLKSLGLRSWQATIYWGSVKLARPLRRRNAPQEMPKAWQQLNRLAMKQYGLRMTA